MKKKKDTEAGKNGWRHLKLSKIYRPTDSWNSVNKQNKLKDNMLRYIIIKLLKTKEKILIWAREKLHIIYGNKYLNSHGISIRNYGSQKTIEQHL